MRPTLEGQQEGASAAGCRLGPALKPARLREPGQPLTLTRLFDRSFVLAHSLTREILVQQQHVELL
jgi:hypothetical protein